MNNNCTHLYEFVSIERKFFGEMIIKKMSNNEKVYLIYSYEKSLGGYCGIEVRLASFESFSSILLSTCDGSSISINERKRISRQAFR